MARKKLSSSIIINTYIKLHKKIGLVKQTDLSAAGIARHTVQHYFGNLTQLDAAAREKYPNKFNDLHVEDLMTPKAKKSLDKALQKYKRFVITTAVMGCEVDAKALKSVKHYCKVNKAKLLVLACADPANKTAKKGGYGTIDKKLKDETIIVDDTQLNSNLFISTIKTTAKQVDPTTGLGRIGQNEGSFIYASPKQRLSIQPTSNNRLPHAIMTTGAITIPNYNTERYMSERSAYIADHDHKMGAIIVEIADNVNYHYRQIQFDESGRFADLGCMFDGTSKKTYSPDSIVPGDWHAGETDPVVKEIIFKMLKDFKPNRIVLHDAFNGESINHHEDHNTIKKAQRSESESRRNKLEDELQYFVDDLNELTKKVDEVVIVKSNHDIFLDRYLQDCDFRKDPQNLRISLKLALAMLDKKDPLQEAANLLGLKRDNKVKWLDIDEDFKVAGIQLGAHGHKGINGSRGTLQATEKAYGKAVIGHSHTPGILRDAWQVGTSTVLKLGYNQGPSSWMQTLCLVYPNGMRQLINIINGEWRIK